MQCILLFLFFFSILSSTLRFPHLFKHFPFSFPLPLFALPVFKLHLPLCSSCSPFLLLNSSYSSSSSFSFFSSYSCRSFPFLSSIKVSCFFFSLPSPFTCFTSPPCSCFTSYSLLALSPLPSLTWKHVSGGDLGCGWPRHHAGQPSIYRRCASPVMRQTQAVTAGRARHTGPNLAAGLRSVRCCITAQWLQE